MTVKELISALSAHNPDARVVLDGYEAGLEDIACIEPLEVCLFVHHKPGSESHIYGPHEPTSQCGRPSTPVYAVRIGIVGPYDEERRA